jgi:hypothetical protein
MLGSVVLYPCKVLVVGRSLMFLQARLMPLPSMRSRRKIGPIGLYWPHGLQDTHTAAMQAMLFRQPFKSCVIWHVLVQRVRQPSPHPICSAAHSMCCANQLAGDVRQLFLDVNGRPLRAALVVWTVVAQGMVCCCCTAAYLSVRLQCLFILCLFRSWWLGSGRLGCMQCCCVGSVKIVE